MFDVLFSYTVGGIRCEVHLQGVVKSSKVYQRDERHRHIVIGVIGVFGVVIEIHYKYMIDRSGWYD